jgi:hypothetical protein
LADRRTERKPVWVEAKDRHMPSEMSEEGWERASSSRALCALLRTKPQEQQEATDMF